MGARRQRTGRARRHHRLSLDSGGAGALEAADLVQSGIAKRVAVFMDPPSGEDHEFIRRGLPYEDEGARQIRQLRSLGVTDIVQIPTIEGGSTEGEGQALPPWCDEHQFRSIVFVAARDHSRRLRRVLDRVMKGHSTRVTVQPARYSNFDPDRWWETRGGIADRNRRASEALARRRAAPNVILTSSLSKSCLTPGACDRAAVGREPLEDAQGDASPVVGASRSAAVSGGGSSTRCVAACAACSRSCASHQRSHSCRRSSCPRRRSTMT